MGDHLPRLEELLAEAISILRRYKVTFWADWLDGDLKRIQERDRIGLDHLLSAYGGMGSLTDVVVSPQNGHVIGEDEVEVVNEDLLRIVSEIYDHAVLVRRALSWNSDSTPAI
jgi:hypothetical protein